MHVTLTEPHFASTSTSTMIAKGNEFAGPTKDLLTERRVRNFSNKLIEERSTLAPDIIDSIREELKRNFMMRILPLKTRK
jgi:hypothetical protein